MGVHVPPPGIEQLAIDTIRTLSIDAVQKANSGHPGAPMALAPVAYALWQNVLRYDPADPTWANRDRFILSNGHASMLLYSTLFLAGVRQVDGKGKVLDAPAVSLEDIKSFRQLDSRTPGHPEYRLTTGVEATTGPLGQGAANSVGMAIASRWLGARYNRPGYSLFDFDVYAILGDGCMMEGISSEAASLAGHLKLSNLCWLYDNNKVSLDGGTPLSFTEDVAARFEAYGWAVTHVPDANDLVQLAAGLEFFRKNEDRPTLVVVNSHIGYGAPKKQDTSAAHGEPLGEDQVRAAKRTYGWPEDAQFLVPDGVRQHFDQGLGARGRKLRQDWVALRGRYQKEFPELSRELELIDHAELPEGWDRELPVFPADPKGMATRESSGQVLNALAKKIPWLLGGAADLSGSTKVTLKGDPNLDVEHPGGRNIYFGVREHAMGAIVNGMVLCGLRAFGSTFLTFVDYMRATVRLASIMEIPTFHVMTHDSIGLGEDGPTHQPIEQLASLRAMPGLLVLRPADANEVTEAYKVVMRGTRHPAILSMSRQALPTFDRSKVAAASGVQKGAYVLVDAEGGKPQVLLMATGSEVRLIVEAQEKLKAEGIRARAVSMPCWELFEKQTPEYRESVLPSTVTARVAVEQAAAFGWDRYAGPTGAIIAMRSFGASAPIKDLLPHFGFTVDHVVAAAKAQLGRGS
jgi:transketolase